MPEISDLCYLGKTRISSFWGTKRYCYPLSFCSVQKFTTYNRWHKLIRWAFRQESTTEFRRKIRLFWTFLDLNLKQNGNLSFFTISKSDRSVRSDRNKMQILRIITSLILRVRVIWYFQYLLFCVYFIK